MGSLDTTRRALFGAIAIAPLALAPAAAKAVRPDMTAWDRALAAFEATSSRLSQAIGALGQAQTAYSAARPQMPDKIPFLPGDTGEAFNARLHGLREAMKAEDAACKQSHRIDELDALMVEAIEADDAALRRIYECPAPTLAAVALKLQIVLTHGESHDAQHVLADLRRFAGEAQA